MIVEINYLQLYMLFSFIYIKKVKNVTLTLGILFQLFPNLKIHMPYWLKENSSIAVQHLLNKEENKLGQEKFRSTRAGQPVHNLYSVIDGLDIA